MATWKKVLLQDQNISVTNITTDGTVSASGLSDIAGSLTGTNHPAVELIVLDGGELKTITADFNSGAFNPVTVNTDTVDMGSGFVVTADTNSNATTIVENETLTIAGGTGISTETTADGTVTITNTVSNTDTVDMGSGFTVTADTNSNATTIIENETLLIAGGTGISTETTADGTVTITNTVSNTMGSGFTVTADTNSNATTIIEGETLTIAGGTGISTETSADGTVTITNSVSNTDTVDMGSGFVVTADTNSNATTIVENETLTIAGGTGISTETTADGTVTITSSVSNTDVDVSLANLITRMGEISGSQTLNIGDAGDDTTVVVRGNLTVNGTTTTLDAATLIVEDKNIRLGDPSSAYANDALAVAGATGGGIHIVSDASSSEGDYASVLWGNNQLTGWELLDANSVAETAGTKHPIAVMDFTTATPVSATDGTENKGAGVGSFWFETDAKDLYIRVD